MNNKGFTLIELLSSIILLAIIMSVTTFSVISFIDDSKDKSYNLLVKSIKIGAQDYFEECENTNIIESGLSSSCNISNSCLGISLPNNTTCSSANIKIKTLVEYGFLKTSATDSSGNKIAENPKTNNNMNNCEVIIYKYVNNIDYSSWYEFKSNSTSNDCPSNDDYDK